MTSSHNPTEEYRGLLALGVYSTSIAWGVFILAMIDAFRGWLILAMFILLTMAFAYAIKRYRVSFRFSQSTGLSIIGAMLLSLLIGYYSVPTIFTGRDQGSIAEAAIRLAENHRLEFSAPLGDQLFKIYGPGRALNFPGFYYTPEGQLITQFPLPYIAWLALFYTLFGLSGFAVANGILVTIFVVAFTLLFRLLSSGQKAQLFLLFVLSSFPLMWFAKFTLTENMALALLWLAITALVSFQKEQRLLNYAAAILPLSLLAFTRIEGLVLLPLGLGILYWSTRSNKEFWQQSQRERMIVPMLLFVALAALALTRNFPYYKEVARGLLGADGPTASSAAYLWASLKYLYSLFNGYGLLGVTIVGLFGLFNVWKQKNWTGLIPFLATLPVFIYVLIPTISHDHPWMLRRFSFAVLPCLALYAFLLLDSEKLRPYRVRTVVLTVGLFILTLFPFLKYLPVRENADLLSETARLSQQFQATDLVLVDQLASGDGWAMIAGPMNSLYHRQTVYFFNPQDLDKTDLSAFSRVLLIAPENRAAFYTESVLGARLSNPKPYTLEATSLAKPDPLATRVTLPELQTKTTRGNIFEINLQR
ncbi:hypothetical protein EPO05_00615 [Patescibacteria group bacterium]|nr:MAG: hypothetical protein EPO05_00615 [Patescibacteria group bacterium]